MSCACRSPGSPRTRGAGPFLPVSFPATRVDSRLCRMDSHRACGLCSQPPPPRLRGLAGFDVGVRPVFGAPRREGRRRPVRPHRCTLRTRPHGWNLERPLQSRWEETDRRTSLCSGEPFTFAGFRVHDPRIRRSTSPECADWRARRGEFEPDVAIMLIQAHVDGPARAERRRAGRRPLTAPPSTRVRSATSLLCRSLWGRSEGDASPRAPGRGLGRRNAIRSRPRDRGRVLRCSESRHLGLGRTEMTRPNRSSHRMWGHPVRPTTLRPPTAPGSRSATQRDNFPLTGSVSTCRTASYI